MTIQWLDGRLVDESDPAVMALTARSSSAESVEGDTSAISCYTTARVTAGRALHPDRHAQRLLRDAKAVGVGGTPGSFDPFLVFRAFEELGKAVFAEGSGIVRIEALASASGTGMSLLATARPIGQETDTWSAIIAPISHHGPSPLAGAKLTGQKVYEDARAASAAAGVDEALLFDANGSLVEGARTNLLIVDRRGSLATPDLALGGVAGIALEIIAESTPELEARKLSASDVADARELIAVNAVRGACSIVRLGGREIGDGKPGPWAERLNLLLAGAD